MAQFSVYNNYNSEETPLIVECITLVGIPNIRRGTQE